MTNILLLEYDETIAFGIQKALEKKGYHLLLCSCIEEAKQAFSPAVHLILLDLNLPDGSGYSFCQWAKKQRDVPIIFLTVRDGAKDITRGLDMGGDDYITKPFHLSVLEARIHAVLRRTANPQDSRHSLLICGDIQMDCEKLSVMLRGTPVNLTAAEYKLLLFLMENKGKTLPRNRLLENLWDAQGNFVNDNTLTVTMKRLREKLDQPREIKTVRGIGYRMEDYNE